MLLILGTNSIKDTGFNVANSCRFNSGSSDRLYKSQSTGNQKTYTFSFWIKRSILSAQENIIGARYGTLGRYAFLRWNGDDPDKDKLEFHSGIYSTSSTSTSMSFKTNRLFRDVSAWYHIVLAVDTTQGTESNRVKIYVNGVQETSFTTATYPGVNQNHFFNISTTTLEIGAQNSDSYLNAYMAEFCLIDGQQLAPTDFGEFDEDSGIGKPIDVSGLTFGTNGFYLDFEDSSALGNDANGGTDFTVNNLTAIDQTTDTPTNNFATLNPLDVFDDDGRTLSEGNLNFTTSSGNNGNISGTLAVSGSGKWYFETKILAQSGSTGSSAKFGIVGIRDLNKSTPDSAGNAYYIYSDGRKEDGANTTNSAHPGYVLNDIVQVAFDLDGGNVYFGLNGNWGNNSGSFNQTFGNATAFFTSINTGGFWSAYLNKNVTADNVLTLSANFGSPSFSISSGNTDGDGYGNFEYAVPSGYYALNTKNLAEYG